jgi:hypothetical protein
LIYLSKKDLFIFSAWIGIWAGIYCIIYAVLPWPASGLIWMTFAVLPIYFLDGAKPNEFVNYICSMVAGVAWAWLYLYCIGRLVTAGLSAGLATGVVVGILTIVVCAVHLAILNKTWLNKVPIIFAGLAMTFSQGGKNYSTIILTCAAGLFLALVCGLGPNVMAKFSKNPSDPEKVDIQPD